MPHATTKPRRKLPKGTPVPAAIEPALPPTLKPGDAAFVAALDEAADILVASGYPEPSIASIVRIAAKELERLWLAGMRTTREEDRPR